MKTSNRFVLSAWVLLLSFAVTGCEPTENEDAPSSTTEDTVTDTGDDGNDVASTQQFSENCRATDIPPPEDIAPNDLPWQCIRVSLQDVADIINTYDPESDLELDDDTKYLLNRECLEVDIPSNLKYVIGAALKEPDAGESWSENISLPLPSRIDISAGDLGTITLVDEVDLPVGTTYALTKVTKFRGQRRLKMVNVASIVERDGKKYFETQTESSQQAMSPALELDGPGLYALFKSDEPLAFVSGRVTKEGADVSSALVVGANAPFIAASDNSGNYTLPMAEGQGAVSAFDLSDGSGAELALPVVDPNDPDNINPKTGEAPSTPATVAAIPGSDTLNLKGVDIDVAVPTDLTVAPGNLDFEDGVLAGWDSRGNVAVLSEDVTGLFPDTRETFYAFISSGDGSIDNKRSHVERQFDIPEDASTLHVEYNYVSQEYPGWVNTQYNDTFTIQIAGFDRYVHYETVNSNAGLWQDYYTAIGNVHESKSNYPAEIYHKFGGQTGVREIAYPIDRCAGERVRLIFGVSDLGDAIYDSAALINRVWFD